MMRVILHCYFIVLLKLGSKGLTALPSKESDDHFKQGPATPGNAGELISSFEPAVYDVVGVAEQHEGACNKPYDATVIIEIYAFERYFTLILKQHRELFSPEVNVKLRSGDDIEDYSYDFRTLYTGKVAGDELSTVTGHIKDGVFDGSFYTAGEMFHLEPASRHLGNLVPFHSIMFSSSAVNFNMSRIMIQSQQVGRWRTNQAKTFMKQVGALPRGRRDARLSSNSSSLDTCPLHITADHLFLKNVGEGSVDKTVTEMLYHLAEVDKIFRSTDFNEDGGPGDNIGINIGAVTVYLDSEAEGPLASDGPIKVTELLSKWSSLNHDAYCLALLFTYRDFADGVLGLAWVGSEDLGGICSQRVALEDTSNDLMSFNTAVVSFLNFGSRVPRRATVITVAHELGHNFGSEHDPTSKLCQPSAGRGRFIMYPLAVNGNLPNNYLFSQCSKASMWPVIYNKGPTCFVAQKQGAYCGNKIVETGEECDCGRPNECSSVDTCCDPGNFTSGIPTCTVKPGNQCSPKKGPCCEFYYCTFTIQSIKKVCQEETECSYMSICNGSVAECPEPISKPANTTCKDGTNTCLDGACVGPICAKFGLDQCECTNHDEMCQVCCKTQEGNCISSQVLTGKLISKLPGSMCNSYRGYCNEAGECVTVDTDDSMTRIKENFKRMTSKASINAAIKWLSTNWYYLVLVVLSICVVALLMRFNSWTCNPLSRLIHRSTRPQTSSGDDNEALDMHDILSDDVTFVTNTAFSAERTTSYVLRDTRDLIA